MTAVERHIYMQDKMFPQWRKYWVLTKDLKYIKRNGQEKRVSI